MATLQLTDNQKVTFAIEPVSAKGNPAKVDGAPVWSTSDDTVLTVEASEDGLSAVVKATGKVGSAQVSVLADADLGDGVTQLAGTIGIDVVAGAAASLNLVAGEITEQEVPVE